MVLRQFVLFVLISAAVYTDVDFVNLFVNTLLSSAGLFMVVVLLYLLFSIGHYTQQIVEAASSD